MSTGMRRPHELDYQAIERLFPPPPEYFETAFFEDPDTIAHKQLLRLLDRAQRAWQVPFFRKRWEAAGFHPDQLRTLDDLWRAPAYTVDDIRASINENPPLGDYQSIGLEDARNEPMRLYVSGGTTGRSRPTLYTAWDREVGAITMARALYAEGIRPGDVVVNAWAYSTHNGAHAFDEALYRWLNCVVLTTGTGNVTSTRKQVELAHEYGAAAILTTGDYMLKMAETAVEMGLDPKADFNIRALPGGHIGDAERVKEVWGVTPAQPYGFHEVQNVSIECPLRNGQLHIFEDCFVVQIVDPETGEQVPDGTQGALVITEIYKTGSPQFRYNIMDLSFLYPPGQCECGSWLRRMGPFAGRGDNMVKLRGVNVWPEAIGEVISDVPGVTEDFFCRAVRAGNRDEMIVMVASDAPADEFGAVAERVEDRIKEAMSVRMTAEVVGPGELDGLTGMASGAAKLVRFKDERP